MANTSTMMAREILEAPDVVERQAESLHRPLAELAGRLQRMQPKVVVTCARGSSAHAAAFAKHLIERYAGIPVAPAAPSIASVYGGSLQLKDQLFLAVSQSGQSEDLVSLAKSARASGALTVAVVNVTESPLAAICDIVLPISAGPELSVAATKTFVGTAAALARLTAAWTQDDVLAAAIERLPARLASASRLDWSASVPALAAAASLVTIGRGPTLAIAREAALKLKETCNLHAEAFSGAEFLHGPVALASYRYPVMMFTPTDLAADGMRQLAARLQAMGTDLFVTQHGDVPSGDAHLVRLPALAPDQPETDAICLIQSFYAMVVKLSRRLDIDVDRPRHLSKITSTT